MGRSKSGHGVVRDAENTASPISVAYTLHIDIPHSKGGRWLSGQISLENPGEEIDLLKIQSPTLLDIGDGRLVELVVASLSPGLPASIAWRKWEG